ncbi:MAG: hydroxymethylbilane synthase [Candidatus Eremiobacteraeota bacterium]|nr:hydroxymethylbilane synthase [Candidatus Eremiobacteraeota bacterium]
MKLRLGTRGSKLALTQSRGVAADLEAACPGLEVEVIIIKTHGDRDQNSALSSFPGKGIFTKEIEDELLAGGIDFAVHSLKDLPTELPAGLCLAPSPPRADPRDVLISATPLNDLPVGAVVGTGSARRRCQLQAARGDLEFREIRGNVPTRVRKWREGSYDAVVLAMAGVRRLGLEAAGLLESEIHPLPPRLCLPAPGQGILGLEVRQGDEATLETLGRLCSAESETASQAERSFLRTLGGGCHIPAGALARLESEVLVVDGFLGTESGQLFRHRVEGRADQAEALGQSLAAHLLELA